MKFATPFWLFAAPLLLAALAALWAWSEHRARLRLQAAFRTPLLDHLQHSLHPARRRGRQVLTALGIGALLFALARPQWGRKEIEIEAQLAIDWSLMLSRP